MTVNQADLAETDVSAFRKAIASVRWWIPYLLEDVDAGATHLVFFFCNERFRQR